MMHRVGSIRAMVCSVAVAGCAHIDFDSNVGLLYYEPVPYLFVAPNADCVATATLVMLPGAKKRVRFVDGYGSVDLSVALTNGMITSVNQKVDNKVSEAITSLAALETARSANLAPKSVCSQPAVLYRIVDGVIDKPVTWPETSGK